MSNLRQLIFGLTIAQLGAASALRRDVLVAREPSAPTCRNLDVVLVTAAMNLFPKPTVSSFCSEFISAPTAPVTVVTTSSFSTTTTTTLGQPPDSFLTSGVTSTTTTTTATSTSIVVSNLYSTIVPDPTITSTTTITTITTTLPAVTVTTTSPAAPQPQKRQVDNAAVQSLRTRLRGFASSLVSKGCSCFITTFSRTTTTTSTTQTSTATANGPPANTVTIPSSTQVVISISTSITETTTTATVLTTAPTPVVTNVVTSVSVTTSSPVATRTVCPQALTNPGFESGNTSPWVITAASTIYFQAWNFDFIAQSGAWYMSYQPRGVSTGDIPMDFSMTRTAPVCAGRRYRFSFYSDTLGSCRATVCLGTSCSPISLSLGWGRYETTIIPSGDSLQISITSIVAQCNSREVKFDTFDLREI